MNDTLTVIVSVPAILAIVNFAKSVGISGRFSIALAVGLGVVLNVANYYLGANGGYQAAVQGLILGLSAAGLYDVTKTVKPAPVAAPAKTTSKSSK